MQRRSLGNVISKGIQQCTSQHVNSTALWKRNFSSKGVHLAETKRKVIFSGIQPTGVPHIGNYLGALRPWVDLQNQAGADDELMFAVVDLHAITAQPDAATLRRQKREMLAALLAIGLSPERCILFNQSAVPEHAELMWILSCSASMGYLSRMTQWKSKLGLKDDASPLATSNAKQPLKLGLFSYPVLQTADILLYGTTHVPVGEDQSQHLEFARETADTFSAIHGPVFTKPQTLISPAKRIMSLHHPKSKMSKSAHDPSSRILISDEPEDIAIKIRTALTDSIKGVSYDPEKRPGISNLLDIVASVDSKGRSVTQLAEDYADMSMRSFKEEVSDQVVKALQEVKERYSDLSRDEKAAYLDEVAEDGARRAREKARETMKIVRDAVGLT